MRRNWQTTPIVFTYRPACPYCQCEQFTQTDQEPQGDDGTVLRFVVCKGCSRPYRNADERFPFHDSRILVDWLGYVPPNDDGPPTIKG
jgi:RNA polymerase subunit RPABC4/transcription elongation factor Spt4